MWPVTALPATSNVNLSYGSDNVTLTITDDGCGFDTGQLHDGMGLHSMRERAEVAEWGFHHRERAGPRYQCLCDFPDKLTAISKWRMGRIFYV